MRLQRHLNIFSVRKWEVVWLVQLSALLSEYLTASMYNEKTTNIACHTTFL